MITEFVAAMYEHPQDAPAGLDLGTLAGANEPLTIGPLGTETDFGITVGRVGIMLVPNDHKIARLLAYALEAWATFAEKEVTDMKARIDAKRA